MCKQLSSQGEILACDEIKEVQLTADKLLYLHAIEISLNAASSEFFGQPHQVNQLQSRVFFFKNLIKFLIT